MEIYKSMAYLRKNDKGENAMRSGSMNIIQSWNMFLENLQALKKKKILVKSYKELALSCQELKNFFACSLLNLTHM